MAPPSGALLLLGAALVPTARGFHAVPTSSVSRTASLKMAAEDATQDSLAKTDVEVAEAAAVAKALLKEERQAALDLKLDAVLFPPGDEYYMMHERPSLVGVLSSSELLDRDEASGFWPPDLEPNMSTAKQMVFIDEISCTGCAWCPHVGRSTFAMGTEFTDYGKARVYQQGEDAYDTIEEAIDVCPAECACTRREADQPWHPTALIRSFRLSSHASSDRFSHAIGPTHRHSFCHP